MLFTGTYFLNLLCSIVPCQGTMRPPEAHIANFNNVNRIDNVSTEFPFDPVFNNSLDPIDGAFSNNEVSSVVRPKRVQNESFSSTTTERTLTSSSVKPTSATLYRFSRYPNLVNPVRTLIEAVRHGVQQSSGLTHNFGNPTVPFPEIAPGNIKRDVQGQGSSGKDTNDTMVYLRNGDAVEGYYMGTMKGRRIRAFEGIPYAEPPIGNLRFRPPVPKRPWRGILKATRKGSECLQGHPINMFRLTGSENCLFLQVYAPQTSSSSGKGQLLPVIFLIHGGSFMYGSGSEYGPAYLVDNDVVVVTFNYRLGPLGFLSTGDLASPGNYGLKDQALALKWVNDNIAQFGGDPDKVTIMGQSAGGVAAHIHLLANKTNFQSGISLSGSALGFWPIVQKKRMQGFTRRLAKYLRCPADDSTKMIECLRRLRPNYIVAASLHFFKWIPFHPLVVFAPVIEPEGPDAYLTKSPEELYESGQVAKKPFIFGQTTQEGHFETYMINLFFQTPILSARAKDLLPIVLDYEDFVAEPTRSKMTSKIMNFYGANLHHGIEDDSRILMNQVSKMYTDRIFTNTIQQAIRLHSSVAPTYAYLFDYMGKYNLGQVFGAAKSEWGVVHTEDLFYFFNSSVFHDGFRQDDSEYKLSQIMTNLISNFARYGEPLYTDEKTIPTKIWDPAVSFIPKKNTNNSIIQVTNDLPIRYMQFNQNVEMISDPFVERYQFWKSLGMKL